MEWLVLVAPASLLVAVLIVPGWAVLTLLGRSGLRSLTAAPAVSLGILAVASLLGELSGWGWGLVTVTIATAAAVGAALAVRRWARGLGSYGRLEDPAERWTSTATLAGLAALGGSMLLWARHLTNILPVPHAFSQTYDNVFHLNVIRYIVETGDSGPWLPLNLDPASGQQIFYPTAWHQLAALAFPVGDATVQVASNATLFVVCAVLWPLSALELTLTLGPRSPGAILSTAVLAASFSAFPFLMLDWGVLYPNLLSYAAIPAGLALFGSLLLPGATPHFPYIATALTTSLITLGITLAHPNGLVLLLLLALPAMAVGALATVKSALKGRVRWVWAATWLAVAALGLAVFMRVWLVARPGNRPWPPLHDLTTALGQALYSNPIMGPPAPIVAFLTLGGLVLLAVLTRSSWFLAAGLLGLALWVVGSGAPEGALREFLTGTWYSDSYRLAPVLTLVSVPAAAFAVDQALLWLAPVPAPRRAGGHSDRPAAATRPRTRAVPLTATFVIPALLIVTTQWSPSLHHAVTHAATAYDFAEDPCAVDDVTCLVTADEYAVLEALPHLTAPYAIILAEPLNGSTLAYALAGRRVLRPYIGTAPTPNEEVVLTQLDAVPSTQALCAAVEELRITHVLDFGSRTVHNRDLTHPGLDELASSPAVREVVRHGRAALYEVVACRPVG